MIIDSHAHLNDPTLLDRADEIVGGFEANNIECCIIAGFDYDSSVLGLKLAEKYNQYALLGTHPENAYEVNEELMSNYLELTAQPLAVGIGEIGLDYHYDNNPPKEEQIRAFKMQIEMASKANLPIALHVRDAYKDTLDILTDMKSYITNGVLLHCYSGSKEMIHEFNRFDAYYALGGAITFKNAKKEDVIKTIPQDRLLVETDCPYLAPHPHRGETNEPKLINLTVEKISEVLGMEKQQVIDLTNRNTKCLFKKIK